MEHLPRPSISDKAEQFNTTLLGEIYDGIPRESFEEYPTKRSFSKEELEEGTFSAEKSQHAAAVLQSWLFFGLLEETFEISIPTADFVRTGTEGVKHLSTHLLNDYLRQWQQRTQNCSGEDKGHRAKRLRSVFRMVLALFQLFVTGLDIHYPQGFVDYLNPLLILLDALQHFTSLLYEDGVEHEPLLANLSTQATRDLIQKSWCPSAIANILSSSQSPSLFAYAGSFLHRPSTSERNHKNCDVKICTLADADTITYRTEHKSAFCSGEDVCKNVRPNMDIVKVKLEIEKFPVTSLEDQNITIFEGDVPYVAVSHVWADGMGSTSEQGIPVCVAKFLSQAAPAAYNSAYGTTLELVPFWIESLCVPKQHTL